MKTNSTEMQERAQQLWRELDGLDWSSHELAIVGILRDALETAASESEQPFDYQDHARLEQIRLCVVHQSIIQHEDALWIIGKLCLLTKHIKEASKD